MYDCSTTELCLPPNPPFVITLIVAAVESLLCDGLGRIEDSAGRLAATSNALSTSTHTAMYRAAGIVHDTREAVAHPKETISAGVSALTATALSVSMARK